MQRFLLIFRCEPMLLDNIAVSQPHRAAENRQNRDIKLCLLSTQFSTRSLCNGSWQLFIHSSQRHCRLEVLATVSRGLFATAPGSCPFPVEPLLIKVLSYSMQWTVCNCLWQLLLHVMYGHRRPEFLTTIFKLQRGGRAHLHVG